MKRILIILLCLLTLCSCTKKVEDDVDDGKVIEYTGTDSEIDQSNLEVMDGDWNINADLPAINDATFETATKEYSDQTLIPLLKLGSQVVNGINTAYLAYGTKTGDKPSTGLRIVVINENNNKEVMVDSVSDFEIERYIDGSGDTTPDGLLGGWSDNIELPNLLTDEQKNIFDSAIEGLGGITYEPVCLLASQLEAGITYAYLTKGTSITASPVTHLYIVTVNVDKDNNVRLSEI